MNYKAEPVAWGMRHKSTGLILDVISPEEHAKNEGGYTEPLYSAAAIAALVAERDAAVAALAASCVEEREQLWEATAGGGCSRAIAAEAALARLMAEQRKPK